MLLQVTFAFLVLGNFGLLVEAKKLPSFVTPCKRSSPKFNECYADAIIKLKPFMEKGVPELGIPPCKPLKIERIELQQPESATVGFNAILTNLTFWGGLDFSVKKMFADIKEGIFLLDLHFPKLKMLSKYKALGKILIISFEGEGDAHGEFGDIVVHANWKSDRITKNGKQHFKVVNDSSTIEVKHISLQLDNLFKNNPLLTENTNRLINENAEILALEVEPIVGRTLINLLTSVVNFVNDRYSIDDLYPA